VFHHDHEWSGTANLPLSILKRFDNVRFWNAWRKGWRNITKPHRNNVGRGWINCVSGTCLVASSQVEELVCGGFLSISSSPFTISCTVWQLDSILLCFCLLSVIYLSCAFVTVAYTPYLMSQHFLSFLTPSIGVSTDCYCLCLFLFDIYFWASRDYQIMAGWGGGAGKVRKDFTRSEALG